MTRTTLLLAALLAGCGSGIDYIPEPANVVNKPCPVARDCGPDTVAPDKPLPDGVW
jgi:hypothetical protein